MMTLDGKKFCICEAVLTQDAKVWKEVRKSWFNVVVEGIMKDYESKKMLAQVSHDFDAAAAAAADNDKHVDYQAALVRLL